MEKHKMLRMSKTWTPSSMGRKGGKARAKALTPERRSEIATSAIRARWRKYRAAKKAAA